MSSKEYEEIKAKYSPIDIPCEVCGSQDLDILQYRGRVRKPGEYGAVPISICKDCGLIFQNPRFEDSFYREYYRELYREIAFGSALPSEDYIATQSRRGGNVLRYLAPQFAAPGTMLDHGCASGATMIPFHDAGWMTIGIDPHVPSVETGVKHLGLDVRVAGGESLPFEDNTFDLIVSLGSLEHVFGFERSMRECYRTLNDKGMLFIRWRSDKLWGSPYEYYNHNHYRFFTPVTWRLALATHGFVIEETTYQEIEGNTGAAYTVARKDRANAEDVATLLAQGVRDDASAVLTRLINYKRAFVGRCRKFLEYADSVGREPEAVAAAVRSGAVDYRLLLGDPSWTVPRAILEAERYAVEYQQDPFLETDGPFTRQSN